MIPLAREMPLHNRADGVGVEQAAVQAPIGE
jgi:hypothetical protein